MDLILRAVNKAFPQRQQQVETYGIISNKWIGKTRMVNLPINYKNFDGGPLGGLISIDLNTGYRINKMLSVNMGITNLLDTRQMEALGSPSIGRLIMFELKAHVPNKKE